MPSCNGWVACLALAALLAAGGPAIAQEIDAAIDRVIEPLAARRTFAGAVVVLRAGEIVTQRAYGLANVERSLPFTVKTPVDGASLAKPFTSLIVLQLVREGKIDLSQPVTRYVAEYPHAATRIADLLGHAGGLPDYDAFAALFVRGEPVTTSLMLREIGRRGSAPAFTPGTRFEYCNLCLDTLALAAERVTGQSYQALITTRIAKPSGIERAFVRPARLRDLPADRAIGYRLRADKAEPIEVDDLEGFYGGSNLYASALDFARFASAFAARDAWLADDRVAALRPAYLGDGTRLPLTMGGWNCTQAATRCYYTGDHKAFHHLMYWDSQRELAVVFVSSSAVPMALLARLGRALIAAAQGEPAGSPEVPSLVELDDAGRRRLAGEYDVPGVGQVRIGVVGERATLAMKDAPEQRLFRVTHSVLYAPGADAALGLTAQGQLWWGNLFVEGYFARR